MIIHVFSTQKVLMMHFPMSLSILKF
ncbi:hypothetical protein Goshw_002215 [Gossypium schwendimanii]|uniref:Uncharacterized protein n=1 Tax=Gossypium schwendimanii TaxID=34291 RepID=A0A7J9L7B2_GOSSC|nr:hypothetical protein [Gossypium schwendimanii]